MKIIINFGQGNLEDGCYNLTVQLLDNRHQYLRQFSSSLPPAPKLAKLLQQWQIGYHAFYQDRAMRINLLESEGMRYSDEDFQKICQQIPQELNNWLSSDPFAEVEKALRTNLDTNEAIQVVITSNNLQLQKLPWHLWDFLSDYPNAEIAHSSPNWQKTKQLAVAGHKIRILAVLGSSVGIDLQYDLAVLKTLVKTELLVLTQPKLTELNEYLWQPQGWNMLLFSGHSHSNTETGSIYLNDAENITISQLKNSLSKAIANGLQIAIFNSCAGMGLALQLTDLSLPYTVVMSEPVPDKIAQVFLKYFLMAFVGGKSFALAVKEARQKLAGWETEYVCASWLPIIWQNPALDSLTWSDLNVIAVEKPISKKFKLTIFSSLVVSGLITLVRLGGWLEPAEMWAYDRLMRQRPTETIDPRIIVVEIAEDDSDRYPLPDSTLVETIDILEQYQPAAIGLDLHRAYERGTDYQELIESLETNPRLFPVCAYGLEDASYDPPQGLSENKLKQQMGFSDLLIDNYQSQPKNSHLDLASSDSVSNPKVRRQLLSYDPNLATTPTRCLTPYSLSFQLAYEYLQQVGVKPLTVNNREQWQFGQVTFSEITRKFGGYQHLEGNSSQIMLNYRSGQPGRRISLAQLRSGKIQPQLIENRIVLIGYTASVARDYFDTPYGTMPGVWIHGHMTSQIISAVQDGRSLIWVLPQWGDWLWILGWSIITGGVILVFYKKPVYSLLTWGILLIGIDRFCLLVLIKGGWLPYLPTFLSVLVISGIILGVRQQDRSP